MDFTEEQLEILRKGFMEHDFTKEIPLKGENKMQHLRRCRQRIRQGQDLPKFRRMNRRLFKSTNAGTPGGAAGFSVRPSIRDD